MTITFRTAKPEDVETAAPLIYSASYDIFDFCFATKKTKAIDFIKYAFTDGRGLLGHSIHTVALEDDVVLGICCLYSGVEHRRLERDSALQILRFFGITGCWAVFYRGLRFKKIKPTPPVDMGYLADFGVSENSRSQGIGTALLQNRMEESRARGKKIFALDVSVENPRGQSLYERFGFTVTAENKIPGVNEVPAARRMEMPLSRARD